MFGSKRVLTTPTLLRMYIFFMLLWVDLMTKKTHTGKKQKREKADQEKSKSKPHTYNGIIYMGMFFVLCCFL